MNSYMFQDMVTNKISLTYFNRKMRRDKMGVKKGYELGLFRYKFLAWISKKFRKSVSNAYQ